LRKEINLTDPLKFLPATELTEMKKGEEIQIVGVHRLVLVVEGRLAVRHNAVITDIVPAGSLVVVGVKTGTRTGTGTGTNGTELADVTGLALMRTKLMMWEWQEWERLTLERAELGVALLNTILDYLVRIRVRLESHAVDTVAKRLAKTLLEFAGRFGEEYESQVGRERVTGRFIGVFTHQLLADYVGTSREIVTNWLNRFREERLIVYSRQGIVVRTEKMEAWVRKTKS